MKQFFTTSLLFLFYFQVVSQIPTAGLLAYYPFSGNTNDATSNGIHPTVVNNVTLTSDVCGNQNSAYLFNGVNSYIELPSSPFIGLNKYSYCFWIKAAAQATLGHGVPFSVGESSFGYGQAVTLNAANFLFAGSYNLGTSPIQSYVTSTTLSFNRWHYVVMTRDSIDVRMYVDGVQTPTVFNQFTNGQPANYGSNLPIRATIGCRPLSTYYFNGAIDELRIYKRALSASEAYALYKSCCPIAITPTLNTICEGESVSLQVSGAASFIWSNAAFGNTISVSPLLNSVFTASNVAQDCPTVANCTVNVEKCTDLITETSDNNMWYPNPSNSTVQRFIKMQGKITILDIAGRAIYNTECLKSGFIQINLSELNLVEGIYFIETNQNGVIDRQHMIINH